MLHFNLNAENPVLWFESEQKWSKVCRQPLAGGKPYMSGGDGHFLHQPRLAVPEVQKRGTRLEIGLVAQICRKHRVLS